MLTLIYVTQSRDDWAEAVFSTREAAEAWLAGRTGWEILGPYALDHPEVELPQWWEEAEAGHREG